MFYIRMASVYAASLTSPLRDDVMIVRGQMGSNGTHTHGYRPIKEMGVAQDSATVANSITVHLPAATCWDGGVVSHCR